MAYNQNASRPPGSNTATSATMNGINKASNPPQPLNGQIASLQEASQTPLPPSSPIVKSPRPEFGRTVSSPRPSPNPTLRRASSSLSLKSERRSSSPAPSLLRKSSTTSLRGGDMPPTPTRLKSRRSSSQLNPNSPLAPAMEEPIVTEHTVAEDYFKQELERHESPDAAVDTVVILHEACYGHRFSRPRSTKGTLSLIVERPERIEASTMGISAAYIRLGERHNEGKYGPDPRIQPPTRLPFKIQRTARTLPINSPAVTQVHGTKWMDELKIMCDRAGEKLTSTGRETERPPDPAQKDKPAFHSGDLYLCQESRAAFEGALGGVCEGVDAVFQGSASGAGPRQAFVCIRPPGHHCSADFPSGFCWLNNVHIGIQYAVKEHQLTHAAIIDFDLHHGDGSQSITWEHNQKVASMPKNTPTLKRTAIGYYSIHDINSYPCEMGDPEKVLNASVCVENAHNQSIWNVHLQPWNTETEFWELYENKYVEILEKARMFLRFHTSRLRSNANLPKPRGAIFISAGFDASEHEGAGMQRHSVNVPTEFYARFTRDIVALAQEEGTGVEGRVISVLEGGYSDKALISGVLSHVSGLCHGQHVAGTEQREDGDRLATQMSQLNMNGLSGLSGLPEGGQLSDIESVALQMRYNAEWWTPEHLDALVEILNPTPTMPAMEAVKANGRLNTFASPTQASRMKQIDPYHVHRKTSAQFNRFPGSAAPSRPSTPPPPTVHWTVAAQELWKLLIPNRQTKSCTVAELAAPKIKKERQSTIGLAAVPPALPGRQLREKRTVVKPSPSIPEQPEQKRVVSKGADRRRTIAANEISNTGANGAPRPVAERPRRRSSIASTVSNVSAVPSTATVSTARPKLTTNGSNGVQVKKTRAPVTKQTPASSRPAAAAAVAAPTSNPSRTPSGDMDTLVQKTQRLKINMPPNDEYLARDKQRITAPKPAIGTTATSKKPTEPKKLGRPAKATTAAAKKPATATSAPGKAKSPTGDTTSDIPGTGTFQVHPTSAEATPESASMGSMTSQFQLDTGPVPLRTPHAADAGPVLLQASSPAEITFPSYGNGQQGQSSLQQLGPAQPPTIVPQAQPPLWSSTGFIPFAQGPLPGQVPPSTMATHDYQNPQQQVYGEAKWPKEIQQEQKDIWDVPSSPPS